MASEGKYWDKAVNPIIIDNCSCEVGDRCWAKQMIHRGLPNCKPGWFPGRLDKIPLKGAPKVYAVNWLCDIAHPSIKPEFISEVIIKLMGRNMARRIDGKPPHTFLLLTKWPMNLHSAIERIKDEYIEKTGIWIGTSITGANIQIDINRLEWLQKFKGFKLWVSTEPVLGLIDLHETEYPKWVDQVIAGAETGTNARPCDTDWLRRIRDDCKQAGVPFFLKQVDAKRNRLFDNKTHDDLAWRPAHE